MSDLQLCTQFVRLFSVDYHNDQVLNLIMNLNYILEVLGGPEDIKFDS